MPPSRVQDKQLMSYGGGASHELWPFCSLAWTVNQLFFGSWPTFPLNLCKSINPFGSHAPLCNRPLPSPRPLLDDWHKHKHTPSHTHTHTLDLPAKCQEVETLRISITDQSWGDLRSLPVLCLWSRPGAPGPPAHGCLTGSTGVPYLRQNWGKRHTYSKIWKNIWLFTASSSQGIHSLQSIILTWIFRNSWGSHLTEHCSRPTECKSRRAKQPDHSLFRAPERSKCSNYIHLKVE